MADKPKLDLRAYGNTGLPVWSGRVYDEVLRELSGDRGRRNFRNMSEQDPIVGGILLGVEMLARQVTWTIKPAMDEQEDDGSPKASDKSKEVAEFIDGALTDMTPTFGATLSEIFSMLPYGWSWLEILYKRREGYDRNSRLKSSIFEDGKVGWAGWQIRSQETLDTWEYDNDPNAQTGELTAMIQMGAPDFKAYRIPRMKSLHFTTRSRRENPEGISLLRNAYRPWYMKNNIETIEGIGVERDLAGLPVMWAPSEIFSEDADPDQKNLFEQLKTIVTNIKRDEQEGVVMPQEYDDKGNKMYELELLSTGGDRQFDTNGIITRYDERIAMSMLADFILMGHQSVGSYALSSTKTGLFSTALSAFLDIVSEEINNEAFPKLVLLNGYSLKQIPTLQHGKIEAADIGKLGDYLNSLSAAGMSVFPNNVLEAFLLESAGLPGSGSLPGAGEDPIEGFVTDPVSGALVPVPPTSGLPTPAGPKVLPKPAAPKDPTGDPQRPRSPRSVELRREVQRAAGEETRSFKGHGEPKRPPRFVSLPARVSKLASKLQEAMQPDDYNDLLAEVMEYRRFTKLKKQYQEAILTAEGRGSAR